MTSTYTRRRTYKRLPVDSGYGGRLKVLTGTDSSATFFKILKCHVMLYLPEILHFYRCRTVTEYKNDKRGVHVKF